MTDLILSSNNDQVTMSSREIAELVNSRHVDVCRTIDRLIEKAAIGEYAPTAYTHHQNGQQYYEYKVGKRDSYVIVAQLSPEFTARLVDRWQELEAQKSALPDFSNPAIAARAWADEVEQKQTALLEANHYKSETTRLNTVCNDLAANLKEGLTPVEFCRMLNGVHLNRVQPDLVERKRLLKTDNGYRTPAAYRGELFIERRHFNKEGRLCEKVVLTQKGAKWLYAEYEKGNLTMRKDWDGTHSNLLFENGEAA